MIHFLFILFQIIYAQNLRRLDIQKDVQQMRMEDYLKYLIQKKNTQIKNLQKVVYLQHGLLGSSFDFIVNDEDKTAGLVLANQGFDVWIGNSRGNSYSLDHKKYNWKNSTEFWQFSWQNMSQYDLPAAFEYINKNTNQKISYVAHSQGTIIMFASLAENNQIIRKYLDKFIAFAPIFYLKNVDNIFLKYLKQFHPIDYIRKFGINYLFLDNKMNIADLLCFYVPKLCQIVETFSSITFNKKIDNFERIEIIKAHQHDSTSTMTLQHWQQMLQNQKNQTVSKFDYGNNEVNMQMYGQQTPPLYSVSNINYECHLFVGNEDNFSTLEDVKQFNLELKNSKVYVINGGHSTFLWAKNFTFFYDEVIPILNQ